MPFTTFTELKTAITDRINRGDMDTTVVDWITIAEIEIYQTIRADWLEKRDQLTFTSAFQDLPTDFNGARNVQLIDGTYRYSLQQLSPDLIDLHEPSTATGTPQYYSIHSTQMELRPTPASGTEVDLIYYFKPTVLSDSNASNELLVNAPQLLFYRAVAEGFAHILDDQQEIKYMARYETQKSEILRDSWKTTWDGNTPQVVADSLRVML